MPFLLLLCREERPSATSPFYISVREVFWERGYLWYIISYRLTSYSVMPHSCLWEKLFIQMRGCIRDHCASLLGGLCRGSSDSTERNITWKLCLFVYLKLQYTCVFWLLRYAEGCGNVSLSNYSYLRNMTRESDSENSGLKRKWSSSYFSYVTDLCNVTEICVLNMWRREAMPMGEEVMTSQIWENACSREIITKK